MKQLIFIYFLDFSICIRLNKRFAENKDLFEAVRIVVMEKVVDVETVVDEVETVVDKIETEVLSKEQFRWWTCTICYVKVKHRQNITRHQSLNYVSIKVSKVKPISTTKQE